MKINEIVEDECKWEYINPYDSILEDDKLYFVEPEVKVGRNRKQTLKRRKKNKNKKTHR